MRKNIKNIRFASNYEREGGRAHGDIQLASLCKGGRYIRNLIVLGRILYFEVNHWLIRLPSFNFKHVSVYIQ